MHAVGAVDILAGRPYVSCEGCFARIDEYVERRTRDAGRAPRKPMSAHLTGCSLRRETHPPKSRHSGCSLKRWVNASPPTAWPDRRRDPETLRAKK